MFNIIYKLSNDSTNNPWSKTFDDLPPLIAKPWYKTSDMGLPTVLVTTKYSHKYLNTAGNHLVSSLIQ